MIRRKNIGMLIFVLTVIAVVAVWWGLQMHNRASLRKLERSGFEIDYRLEGVPEVVLDEDRRQIAFIKPGTPLVLDYAQVLGWEVGPAERRGWSNKSSSSQSDEVFQITFRLQDRKNPLMRVRMSDPAQARRWDERLGALLSR